MEKRLPTNSDYYSNRDNKQVSYFNNVIVIGGEHHNTLGVVRALGMAGFGVDLITIGITNAHYVSSSRYVRSYHVIESIEELTVYLLSRPVSKMREKIIIISCADSVTEHLNLHHDQLTQKYLLPGCAKQGEMERLMNKATMIQMAEPFGLRVPDIWRIPQERDKITFPCITKSYISSHGSKQDIRILQSEEELNLFLSSCSDEVFVQPFIKKKEEVQFIGCSLKEGEEVIIPGMTHIIRSQPNTNTGFLEFGPIDPFYEEIVERSKQYIKTCGYSGLFSIEFIRSTEDEVFFLEINFRNDGNAWCVTAAGVNLPVIWVKACLGKDYRDEIKEVKKILVMPEFQDFKLVLQGKVRLGQWIKDVRRTDAFFDWNKNDKRPFFRFIFNKFL